MMEEITKFGTQQSRIYADWTSPQCKWLKGVLLEHAITSSSNTVTHLQNHQTALIIDAMDHYILVNMGFCIVSSDSDLHVSHQIKKENQE
jgi:hypothetical protein